MTLSVLALSISATATVSAPVYASQAVVSQVVETQSNADFNTLIQYALANDSSRKQIAAQSNALRAQGVASATLMDPKIKLGFGGLPVDSFEFDVDPMTNVSIGLMQQFERGSTLELQQRKANQQADGMSLQAQLREREIVNSVTQLWLELGYQQQAERVIEENLSLLNELMTFTQTNYSIGTSETQDLLNAQLKVSQLEDKRQANAQQQRRIHSQLSEWLGSEWLMDTRELKAQNNLDWSILTHKLSSVSNTQYYPLLQQHPMIQIADANIAASETQVSIAEQAYTPQFGVEVMYANRQANNMMGEPASDLLSAYITMDIPLFTGNKQDKNHEAAQFQVGAAKSNKDLLLAQMNAQVNALLVDKTNLEQRVERYATTLIPQVNARTQAVERGYQNNTSQFSDVINATRDQLAVTLEQQRLITDLNLVQSNLATLLGAFSYLTPTPADTQANN
ncbi:TolC family protein [Vibrio makurazakiensis]|uniref:TolC family protein n=1 Tax=Vibrio makurazakiensis TaxID=2910250 RepID=UPI003D123911